ncbi:MULTISPECIES: hypothetical protein [Streptomyces]|uniref:PhoU domain-containing protein n=1 Tax=Streptomyces cellulosae TaxID=1968 RepID=A0ABW7YI96_STRCE
MSYEPHRDSTQAVARRLNQHQLAVVDALKGILDIETGLREILIQSQHDAATDELDTVLDTESGLAAILPPANHPAPPSHPETQAQPNTPVGGATTSVSAPTRLALRSHHRVASATRVLGRDRSYARELDLSRASTEDRHLPLVMALLLARDLSRDLVRALEEVTKSLDAHRDVEAAYAQELALSRRLARAVVEARDLEAHELVIHVRTIGRAPFLGHGLRQIVGQAHRHNLALVLSHIKDLDRDLDTALYFVHGQERARDNTFTRALLEIRTNQVRRALDQAVGRPLPGTEDEGVIEFLNDFTKADLRQATLVDVDLSGILWSEYGTQWPTSLDVEELKRQSEETPPGSKVWIVRADTTTVSDFAEL